MKRLAILAISLLLGLAASHAQWWQTYSRQTSLVLSLHLQDSAVEMYSPLQSATPLPVSNWNLKDDTLIVQCQSIGFKAVLHKATRPDGSEDTQQIPTWEGYWKQGILKESVTFLPADTLFRLRRPQTPQQPYPFAEETVVADYTDSQGNAIHLEGTLTYPPTGGPFPTLVLVSGSGQQNRDEEIFHHKPFLVLADYMARRGIAVLRYDDRGVGASTGPIDSADTYSFAEDAEAMLEAVRTNPHVDPARLGMGGHSEGAAIAPMVAARNAEVRFVLMLAGQGCTGKEVMVQQNEALFRARGVSDRLCRVRGACMREMFAMPDSATVRDYQVVIVRHTAPLSKAEADSIELRKGMAYALKQQMDTRWLLTFLKLDPAVYLPRVTVPILALNGTRDCQVPYEPNLSRIDQLTNGRAVCIELRWLNHLFQHCDSGSPDEYMMIEETFDPFTMMTIADWILGLSGRSLHDQYTLPAKSCPPPNQLPIE